MTGRRLWRLTLALAVPLMGQTILRAAPSGKYEVTQVLLDPKIDNLHARFIPGDPRLLGRIVNIDPPRASLDDGDACVSVTVHDSRATIAATLAKAMHRPPRPGYAIAPTPAELGLKDNPARLVIVSRFSCDGPTGARIPGHNWTGALSFPLAAASIALLWQGEALLVLAPLDNRPPHASFDCSRAVAHVDRTICGDAYLASWDRSIAAAYKLKLASSDDRQSVIADQRHWVTMHRNEATDISSLHDEMAERVDVLLQR